ncbi:hypothetical protein TWF696_009870 [Orbilia brochopaga]|uniref:Elongator complex protein 1 n=1 Tax=Orbilia brochopaga TaxID=3140254 RepID=A0AAV9UG91_9PEZI
MRNLLSTRRVRHRISSSQAPDLPLAATEWDAESDSIICAFGPSPDFPTIEISRITANRVIQNITSWNYQGPCPKEGLEVDRILNLHYFGDDSSICLVLEGGDVILIREDPGVDQSQAEIVGSVEEGIKAASWSPDEGLLAIATAAETFILMTRQFEPVADAKLLDEDLKLSKHVNVGWGKKETQFKGKRAAALRDPTIPEKVDEGTLSPFDTGSIRLSWRGDAQFIAVSTIQSNRRRVIRVFGRNGELDGVSEPVDGMEDSLSWRPSGNIIASTKRDGESVEVIFFERNGLRHGEFRLPLPKTNTRNNRVYGLNWNADSTVLAVCLQDRVQLWTTANYHWYLKCEIRNQSAGALSPVNSVPGMKWHPEKALHLHTVTEDCITELDFSWIVHHGAVSPPYDFGVVVVIDGRNLKLTPLRFASVPPPMSLHDLLLDGNTIDVAFSPSGDSLIALTTEQIDIIDWDIPKLGQKAPVQLRKGVIRIEDMSEYRQVSFFGSDKVALLHSSSSIDIYQRSEGSWVLLNKLQDSRLLEGVASIKLSDDKISLLCETLSGDVLVFNERLEAVDIQKLPLVSLISDSYAADNEKRTILGLAESGRLFVNERLLTTGCTSFVLTNSHIIITTTQNLLKFIQLTVNTEDLQVPPDDAAGGERCRSVERGSKLVTVIPSTFAVVLQMPRGNLETIYPRALVLAGIRDSIDAMDYKTAFSYCRTHRVDLNILYDHNPVQFMASIDIFLDQIGNPQYVDLFLSMLRDEDVTKTMYDPKLHNATKPRTADNDTTPSRTMAGNPDKVNIVCDAILAGIKRRTSPNTQNLVTCYVSKKPPDLDSGLSMISKMRTSDQEKADFAIEHICFLADVNKLYDHALGIYDLELALLIAQQSQKDPREYLPFLQSIRVMTPLRQKHYIDDFLGRHNKAAVWLRELGDDVFAELSEYTVKHNLYRQVADLVKYDEEKRKIITKLHAEYLIATSNYREAGLSFEQLALWESALVAYQKCGMWQEALYAASRIPLSLEETKELAGVLADALIESKDFKSAARIYLDYHNDIKEAVSAYCRGSFFEEAMRVVALKQEFHLLDEVVDSGLVESFNTTSELIADFLAQIQSQISRIKELREKKQRDPLAFYGASGDIDAPDNVSVAGTDASTAAGSIFTRYTDKTGGTIGTSATRRSSKNRRREERKKARGKKGSVYEEEYLVNSIARLIARLNETQAESYRLIEGLVRRGMRERAETVQLGIRNVLAALEQGRKEVFDSSSAAPSIPSVEQDHEPEDGLGPNPVKPPDFSTIQGFKGLSIL